jgi:hypothetical protein
MDKKEYEKIKPDSIRKLTSTIEDEYSSDEEASRIYTSDERNAEIKERTKLISSISRKAGILESYSDEKSSHLRSILESNKTESLKSIHDYTRVVDSIDVDRINLRLQGTIMESIIESNGDLRLLSHQVAINAKNNGLVLSTQDRDELDKLKYTLQATKIASTLMKNHEKTTSSISHHEHKTKERGI